MPLVSRNIFKMLRLFNNKQSYQIVRLLSSKEVGYAKSPINEDLLIQHLKSAPTTQNILDLISTHHKIMNNNHIIQAFRSMFTLQKNKHSSVSTNSILLHPNFKTLCTSLKYNVRSIETNELIEMLKILSYVGVPSNSTIIQTILQMIRQDINQLYLQQIIFLDFLLKQFQSTPLSDALLIALPIVFEVQLHMKADTENLIQLTDFLQYSTSVKLSDNSINFLLEAISKHKHIDPKSAVRIAWSICDLKQNECFEMFLKKLLKILTLHSSELSISDLETVLTKLVLRFNKKYQFYFNEEFFGSVVQKVINDDLGFQQSIWILQKLSKVGYTHNGLLDYISNLCHNNHNLIVKMDSWNLYNLVSGFANNNYKPKYWESVKQEILENQNIFDSKRKFGWIKFSLRLALLDIYIPEVLENTFKIENIEKEIDDNRSKSHSNSENFLVLYQTISTLRPEYSNMLPDISYVEKAMKNTYLRMEENNRVLKGPLEHGLGDESYVLTNVRTKLGHLLHHVVVLRKGGYPVALSTTELKQPVLLEDIKVPAESHIIVIFGFTSSYYKVNSYVLRDIYSLMFRTIESSGHSVIPVCLDTWNNLLDYEKIPYLMQLIKEKYEEFSNLPAVQSFI